MLVLMLSGLTPICWPWAYYAPSLLEWHDVTVFQVWSLAIACYMIHGFLLESLPLPQLQPSTQKPPLSLLIPRVTFNLSSALVLTSISRPSHHVSDWDACVYLVLAAIGNEIIYACIHRLLHTKPLFKYHSLHHQLRAPRPLGAVYCSLVEMWIANLASFLLPLVWTDAPIQIYLIWIISGIQTTQIHHSGKAWPWPLSLGHQPRFHDDHHRFVCRNFGNIGFFEFALKKAPKKIH